MKLTTCLVAASSLLVAAVQAGDTRAPTDAAVYFIQPQDGATVRSPVTVVMGLRGMGIAPAGTRVDNTGHHHLVIDAPTPGGDAPIPSDARHVHFGGGQTEASLALAPGEHTLQLVLGDAAHVPHDPPLVSRRITITVE